MSQRTRILAEIWGFRGWKIDDVWYEDERGRRVLPIEGLAPAGSKVVLRVSRTWAPRCACCGAITDRIHERLPSRRWRDLPWVEHVAEIDYAPVRVACRRCGRTGVEAVAWADPKQRQSRRFQHMLALQAASMPVQHVAALLGLDWGTVRRAEQHALSRWDRSRTPPPLRQIGIDEKYLGRRNKLADDYVTIVSNLETGEPLWIGYGRSEATVAKWLATQTPTQKAAITLAVMDLHAPFAAAIRNDPAMKHVEIAHDPFHVMKRAGEAIDELRRETFFRAGEAMRRIGRGTRWLVLRAWEKCSETEQGRLRDLFKHNQLLARAYQIKEELREVLRAPDGLSMSLGLDRILRRTERRCHKPLRRLHDSLVRHRPAIQALADHRPAAGRVEALNNNWETLVRRGRGYRNHEYLLLKLRFTVANPIRKEDGVKRFLALALQPPPVRTAA